MAALNLQDVCYRLSSSQVRSRQTGLSELQRFLNQDDTSSRLGDEKTYAAVLHSLTRNFSLELAAFRKSNSAQATSSLQISAECLQASTEKARLFMKRPTAKVLLAHILETLPSLESPEYKIVSSSYFATLKLITSHPPHIEQMKKEVWIDLVHLCIAHVEVENWFTLSTSPHQTADTPVSESRPFESRNMLSIRKEIVDLMLCLQSLCTFPGAPFEGKEDIILIFLVNFLATYDTQTDARMSATIVLNHLLWHLSFNKLDLVSRASIMIVHLFSREKLWTIRVPGFQERLLITLSLVYPHLYRAVSQRHISATTTKAINTIVEKLMLDLRNQDPRNALGVDDLVLSVLPSSSPLWRQRPFQSLYGPYFSHNPHSHSSEITFLSLQLQASFIQLLDIEPIEADLDSTLPEDSPRKRRRILPDLSFERHLIHPLKSKSRRPHRVACLQVLALYLNSFRISEASIDPQEILNLLEQLSAESDTEIMNWSFVGMLGILGRLRGSRISSADCAARWTRIWIACSKQAAIPSTCRAACAVMESIVSGGFLRVRSLIPHINGIMEYVEQRGPGLFADKSCDFWTSLLRSLQEEGISTKTWRSNALSRWIRFRWGNEMLGSVVPSKHINLLPFPFLRVFTTISSSFTDVLQFRHLASLPKSPLGDHLHNLASNMSLQNLLLECEINNGMQGLEPSGLQSLTTGLEFHDILAPIFKEKCLEISKQLSAAPIWSIISEDDVFWCTSIAIMSSTFPCKTHLWLCSSYVASQPSLTLLTSLTTLLSTSKSPTHIDACLRAVGQFSAIIFFRNDNANTSSGTSVTTIHINHAPVFRELADVLCRLSGLFHVKESADRVYSEFTEDKLQLAVSASDLDTNWALRDISRAHLTYQGWRTRALARFQSDLSFRSESFCLLEQNSFRNTPVMSLLLAAEQIFERPFGGDDAALPTTTILLESFKTEVAATYSWGGNEMTVVAAMTIVERALSRQEAIEFTPEITNLVTQLYRWVIKVAVNRDLSSANARIRAAEFLRGIARIDVNYGNESQAESRPGDLLIRRLQDRDIRVKFDLAEQIRSTFLCFHVVERFRIYGEIVDNLEGDEKFSEGFALRAYTLMQLALTSDDLRRAAMMNLLELGNFVSCKAMVHACFMHIAKILYHGQLTTLFSQNSSQFINSWIEFDEDIFQFPYHAFGFTTLDQWSSSVQGELISQLINADRWDDAANLFLAPLDSVLIDHLPRVISYAFLNDSGQSVGGGTAFKQCEAALGKEIFRTIMASNLALSMSIMIERLDDKTLSSEAFIAAGLRSQAMIFSTLDLPDPGPTYPDPPQPFFSTHRVLAALDGLRVFLGMPLQQVWSSAHVSLIVRDLISNATTTSDTTVALSCIRRIAFILCVAHDTMLTGYPFEMLVNGLNELAGRESTCREAISIIKYLFSLVSKHTSTNPQRIRYMATILISAMEELSRTSALLTTKELIADVYDWLETLLQTVFPDHVALRSTVQLLHALTNNRLSNNITACQVMENLIVEDTVLWGELRLRQFSLHFLSKLSNPACEPLSTIRPVVAHLLTPFNALIKPEYPMKSKIWLGVALGRVSHDSRFHQPEYRSVLVASKTYGAVEATGLYPPEVMVEVVRCTRLNSTIAGLLEQGLRGLPADTAFRLPSWFNGDCDIIKYLSSPNVKSPPSLMALRTPSLSDVKWWGIPDQDFTTWYRKLACSIALRLPNTFFSNFVPALDASIEFCESIFPYLVDEYRCQPRYDGSVTKIFNSILENFKNYDLEYLRLIIRNILFLRERSSKPVKSKKIPLVDDIDYLHAAKAAVACTMSKTALMFLEIANVGHTNEPAAELERLLSQIYRSLEDPDLTYALSQGVSRSWNQLLHVFELHHDHEAVQDLRRARLRGKMELGTNPSGTDDDLLAVADQIRQNGFPLNSVNIINGGDNGMLSQASTTDLYKSAWRLGTWDLPPLTTANHPDPLIYTVLYQLMQSGVTDPFLNTLDSSITRALDQLVDNQCPAEISSMVGCLKMLADIFMIFSGPDTCVTSGRKWARKILTQAEYGRY
jgi:serine-protein kinase ATM